MTERIAFIAAMFKEGRIATRVMPLEACQDGLHDQCLETRPGILSPSTVYVCDCSCRD